MKGKARVCLVALVFAASCLHEARSTKAFTREWADAQERRHEKEVKDRELVLVDQKGPVRTAVRVSDDGKASLVLGGKSGLRAKVGMSDGDPKVDVSYGWEW